MFGLIVGSTHNNFQKQRIKVSYFYGDELIMILHSPQYILPSNQTHYNTIHFVTIFVLQISHFLRIQKYCPKCTTSCEVNLVSSLNVACTCRKEKSKISYQENFISLSYQSMCKKSAQPLNSRKLKLPSAAAILNHSFKEHHLRPNQKAR